MLRPGMSNNRKPFGIMGKCDWESHTCPSNRHSQILSPGMHFVPSGSRGVRKGLTPAEVVSKINCFVVKLLKLTPR